MKSKLIIAVLSVLALSSCSEDFLELDPIQNTLEEDEALQTQSDIQELLNSAYDVTGSYYSGNIQVLGELLSDNLDAPLNNNDFNEVYIHNTLVFNSFVGNTYADPYLAVFRVNRMLEVLEEKDFGFGEAELRQLQGEAYFLRAIAHFENVRLMAQPYSFTSDNSHLGIIYKTSTEPLTLPRPTVASNYQNIIADLEKAEQSLPLDNGIFADGYAAKGFLAKVYFQMGDYTQAAQKAGEVINSGAFSLHPDVDRFVQETSPEAVFEVVSTLIDPVDRQVNNKSAGFSGNYGQTGNDEPQLTLSSEFWNLYSQDTTDSRLGLIEVFNPGTPEQKVVLRKFRREYFNVPVLSLTDLKLLRAEALALSGGDLSTAIQDVNDIKERAYGSTQNNLNPNASAAGIIEEARFERRIEMVGEGDRIQQLKRRGAIEGENIEVRGDAWDCNGMILQFPAIEETEVFPLNPTGGCS